MVNPINIFPEELSKRKRIGPEEVIPVPQEAVPEFGTPALLTRDSLQSNLKQFLLDCWRGKVEPKHDRVSAGTRAAAIKDIWSKDQNLGWTQAISMVLHAGLIALLVVPFLKPSPVKMISQERPVPNVTRLEFPLHLLKTLVADDGGGGGGGGDHSLTVAGKGKPPKFSLIQFALANEVIKNPRPFIAMTPTILGPPELNIESPNKERIGDPLSNGLAASNGPGKGGGIGSGNGTGIGSGDGSGLGPGEGAGTGGGPYNPGTGGVGGPSCFYMPNPPYSEEARKAKYSGVVLVDAVVAVDGRVTDARVIKSPGLGLDDMTVTTMKSWRCKAALGPSRRPVPTRVQFEVSFRLY